MRSVGSPRALRTLLLCAVVVLSAHATYGSDGIELIVTKSPVAGPVQLDWTGAGSVFGVFRSNDPTLIAQPSTRIGQSTVRRWFDTPPIGPITYYLVTSPACDNPSDCGSGFCVDGACCDSSCSGPCQSCRVAGSVGQCAAPEDDDPTHECSTVCANLPPLPNGTCTVIPGGPETLLVGTVLAATDEFVGGEVLIDATGMITCVGCGCAASAPGATVVRCPKGVISPGLINSLDFLANAQNHPRDDTGERYEHRHEWRIGLNGHTRISVLAGASTAQRHWGELRQLIGGATSLAGSSSVAGLMRNLNDATRLEGLSQQAILSDTFPLGDSGGTMLASGCGYPSIRNAADLVGRDAYQATVAEGIREEARNEFRCVSSSAGGGQDLTQPQSAFRHLVGLTAAELGVIASEGTGLIWSPRSNLSLYGDTVPVIAAQRLGVEIALATDWIVSGSMSLRRELQCAENFDDTYLGNVFTSSQLFRMVTANPAALAGMNDAIGSLAPGLVADITIFDGALADKYRAVIEAGPPEVVLVMRGGTALYGDAAIVQALRGPGCDSLDVCGRSKQVCVQSETGLTLASLQAQNASSYPLLYCGVPDNEPLCRPQRSGSVFGSSVYDGEPNAADPDGDGILSGDNCPRVFNPVRPLDVGTQADVDEDGVGDACDLCPTTVSCP